MVTKTRDIGYRCITLVTAICLAMVLLGTPAITVNARTPVPPHHFWGHVMTTDGNPAAGVEVTAWINGELRGSITTDESGSYGSDPLVSIPYYLTVTGLYGDIIEFRIEGTPALETRLGELRQTDGFWEWQWQDLTPEWQAVFQAREVNGLDLVWDTTPPTPITDLTVSDPTNSSITLNWTAPGDNGNEGTASRYDIRYLEGEPVTDNNWDSATQCTGIVSPQPAGSSENFIVTNLNQDRTYYFAIRTADNVNNWSTTSNSPSGKTDITPPAQISNLAASNPYASSITLAWTAPGDNGNQGIASQYDIRYLEGEPVTDNNWDSATQCRGISSPQPAGSSESFTVTSLKQDTTYYFAIRTTDEVSNWSTTSNSPGQQTAPATVHQFWGHVRTNDGEPAASVNITAWINGEPRGSIITDAFGQFGKDPLVNIPAYLDVTGQNGDIIKFRVGGILAQEAYVGVLVENGGREWQWQDLPLEWQSIYAVGDVHALDIIYNPDVEGGTTWGDEDAGIMVSINATYEQVTPGGYFTATVDISEIEDLDAGSYDVSFDPTVLSLKNVTSGDMGGITIPVVAWNEISPGTFIIAQDVPRLSGVSGSGYLAVLHFRVVGSIGDSSNITLSNAVLSSSKAMEIPALWTIDSVEVLVTPGDATGDGSVNAVDITEVERIIVSLGLSTHGADANLDGKVNAIDITMVERIIAGLSP